MSLARAVRHLACTGVLSLVVVGGAGTARAVVTPPPSGPCCVDSSIESNFNGTSIPAGAAVWFSANMKVSGVGADDVTISATLGSIDSPAFHVDVPDALIVISHSATVATTTYDVVLNRWVTTVPATGEDEIFLQGAVMQLPGGLPGGVKPVTWSVELCTDTPGITIQWKWGAAAYSSLEGDLDALGVKPVHDGNLSGYHNSDHAGTPENFKHDVIGGARGGGGSNFTGSWSATKSAACE